MTKHLVQACLCLQTLPLTLRTGPSCVGTALMHANGTNLPCFAKLQKRSGQKWKWGEVGNGKLRLVATMMRWAEDSMCNYGEMSQK